MIRIFDNKGVAIYHRFKDSKKIADILIEDDLGVFCHEIISSYGIADKDFSAQAWFFDLV